MYTGMTGALKIVNALGVETTIAYISGWSVEETTEMIESNKIGHTEKNVHPGFQSWSASADGTVTFEGAGGHDALFNANYEGTKILFYFYLNDGSLSDKNRKNTYFCGTGYIQSLSVDISAEDKGNISISVAGTGALELYVNNINTATDEDYKLKDTLSLKIEEDGHLYAKVPDSFDGTVWVDESGHLIIKL